MNTESKKIRQLLIFIFGFLFAFTLGFLDQAFALTNAVKVENRLSLVPNYFFQDIGKGTSQWATPIFGESEISWKATSDLKVRFSPWIYSDPVSPSSSERLIVDLNEASVDWRRGDWLIRMGLARVAWGVTDVFNPLDVVSARRYMDPLGGNSENDKRATPSIDLSWEGGAWRLEGIYIPVQLPAVMPGENSRWLPRDLYLRRDYNFATVVLSDDFRYRSTDPLVLDDALRNNFGFRIQRNGSGVDLTAMYFQGSPTAPAVFTPEISGTLVGNLFTADEITLQPVYYRRETAGVGAVVTLQSYIVRFAASASDRRGANSSVPGWTQNSVLGLERSFAIGTATLTTLLQGTFAQTEVPADNTVTSLERIFDRSLLLGLRLVTSNEWTTNLAVLYDGAGPGWYEQLRIEKKLTDGFTLLGEVDLLQGDAATPLGTYRRNGRVALGLQTYL
jgi:hypothetical protein